MIGGTKTFSFSRWPEAARWGACFALAVAFHAAGAAALFARWTEDSNLVAGTAVVMVDLAPDPQAEPVVAVTPPPKLEPPKEKKPKQKHASLASAPTRADQQVDRPAAPMPGLSSRNSDALPNWKTQLVAKLERAKRYPSEARGDQGIAQLAFSVDRQGGVHNARIVRSSGSSVLDHETLALVQRAQPLPPPPPEVSGAQIPIVVPIRYNAR